MFQLKLQQNISIVLLIIIDVFPKGDSANNSMKYRNPKLFDPFP